MENDFLTDNLYSVIEDKLVRPEEAFIRRVINRYKATQIKLTQVIKNDGSIHPFTRLYDKSADEWEYGDLILRKYVNDQLALETTVYPERIRIQNHVEKTDILLNPNNVSFYGSKGETLMVRRKFSARIYRSGVMAG